MRKYLFLLPLFWVFAFACGGDCLSCHQKLEPIINDKDHIILNNCIQCHNTPTAHGGACGQDCFECHSREKLYSDKNVPEHQAIKACSVCHKEKVDFMKKQQNPLSQNSLVEFIKVKE